MKRYSLTDVQNDTQNDHSYEGYLWFENAKEPHIIQKGDIIDWKNLTKNALYIAEGMLCNETQSIHIKGIDGKEQVSSTLFSAIAVNEFHSIHATIATQKNTQRVKLLPVFDTRTDPFATDFEELFFKQYVFLGFETKHNKL